MGLLVEITMDLQEAITYVAAIITVVGAGVLLGAALRGRGQHISHVSAQAYAKKTELYSEIISSLDTVAEADSGRKQWFIHRYYQLLAYAPDHVIRHLNHYLDSVSAVGAELSSEGMLEIRGRVIRAMRRDLHAHAGTKTNLKIRDFYKIEVKPNPTVNAVAHDQEAKESKRRGRPSKKASKSQA